MRSPCRCAHPQLSLDLLGQQVIGPIGLGHVCLALDGFQHQCRFTFGGPVLNLFFHQCTHGVFFSVVTPEQVFTESMQIFSASSAKFLLMVLFCSNNDIVHWGEIGRCSSSQKREEFSELLMFFIDKARGGSVRDGPLSFSAVVLCAYLVGVMLCQSSSMQCINWKHVNHCAGS